MIRHHPALDLLFDHATGSLPEAVSLAVATHVATCPSCCRIVAETEAVGGAMMQNLPPIDIADETLKAVLARIDEPDLASAAPSEHTAEAIERSIVPPVLRPYLGATFDDLPWRPVANLFEEAKLPSFSDTHRVSILRARRGGFVPMHGHGGQECLAVLNGGFRCTDDVFESGDFTACDSSTQHEPIVDTHDECVCLLVLDASLRFAGTYERDLDPIFQM